MNDYDRFEIAVIIPCFNEEDFIFNALEQIENYLSKRYNYKLIVIDDSSRDSTEDMFFAYRYKNPDSRAILISHEKNMGKGQAVLTGMMASMDSDYCLIMDCDMSAPINMIERLYPCRLQYDMVAGSRHMKGSQIIKNQPIKRRIMSKLFYIIVQTMFGFGIRDSQCGMKLISHDAMELLINKSVIQRFAFDVEFFAILRENNFTFCEIPIQWSDTKPHGASNSQAFSMLKDLFKIRKNAIEGKYYVDKRSD
jgi:glycosyltransferase involved in cell wall biosynthesis